MAKLACKYQVIIGHPYERDFKSLVINNMVQNCPITASEVTNDHTMFGLNLDGARGKTVQQKLDRVVMDYVASPNNFIKLHNFVTLVVDVMFVNSASFLITVPRGINFVTVEHMPTRMDKQLIKSLKLVMIIYSRSGMIVHTVLMDLDFDKTIDNLMEYVVVDTFATQYHVA